MEQAIQARSHAIGLLNIVSPDTAKTLLTVIITDLVEFLNVGMTMNVPQIEVCVHMILSDPVTKNLKPEDFKVCFDQFKKTGKTYNRVDGQVIFNIIYEYAKARLELTQMFSDNEHQSKRLKNNVIQPEVVEMYKEALKIAEDRQKAPNKVKLRADGKYEVDSLTQEEVLEQEKNELEKKRRRFPVIEKSPRDLFIQKCFDEFEILADRKPSIDRDDKKGRTIPGRYIDMEVTEMIDNHQVTHVRPVDQVEYAQFKLAQWDTDQINNSR
jgi:hypothetical protein